MEHSFFDMNYVMYILGFFLVPRFTTMLIFYNYVTHGFEWSLLYLPINLFMKSALVPLSVGSKVGFLFGFSLLPRVLLAYIGYLHFSQSNGKLFIAAIIIGFIVDIAQHFYMFFKRASEDIGRR